MRARSAQRRPDRTPRPRDLRAKVIDVLAEQPLTRSQLMQVLRYNRQRMLGLIRELLQSDWRARSPRPRRMCAGDSPSKRPPGRRRLSSEPPRKLKRIG